MQVRSIDALSSSWFLLPKNSKKGEDEGTLVTKDLDEKQIFNYLNFTSNKSVIKDEKSFKVPDNRLKDEIRYSAIAKNAGVNAPEIDSSGNYKVKYNKADIDTNPISTGHIKNILNSIDAMDKQGLIHGDIEVAHTFYSKKSDDVEFDCFRFGYLTNEKPHAVKWDFPECQYPTNLNQFENNCIGNYLSQMKSKEEKDGFIKEYLPIAAEFHGERADYLEKTGKGTPDQIEYEKTKAKLYKDPDDTVVNLFEQRVEMEYIQRQYFTDWDEGMGAGGIVPDENRAVGAVCAHFDSIHNGLDYYNKLSELEFQTENSTKKHFIEYEKEYAEHFVNNRVEQIGGKNGQEYEGMTFWTLNPKNEVNKSHTHVPDDKKEQFNRAVKGYKKTPIELKSMATTSLKSMYQDLLSYG